LEGLLLYKKKKPESGTEGSDKAGASTPKRGEEVRPRRILAAVREFHLFKRGESIGKNRSSAKGDFVCRRGCVNRGKTICIWVGHPLRILKEKAG